MVIFVIIIVLGFLFIYPRITSKIESYKQASKKPFVCPNCGYVFYVKWYQLFPSKGSAVHTFGKAKMKCPGCQKTDFCRQKD